MPVIDYVDRMPSEFSICFGKAAIARDVKLVTTKGFQQWAKNHSSLDDGDLDDLDDWHDLPITVTD